MKICKKCGAGKMSGEFYIGRNVCKACRAEYNKMYREGNGAKISEQQAGWRIENRDKIIGRKARWYKSNKDKVSERNARYRANNKEKMAAYKVKWCEKNKEKEVARKAEYYKSNKDKHSDRQARYYKSNKEKISVINKRWRKENREKCNGYWQTRRSLKKALICNLTEDQYEDTLKHFNYSCAYCDRHKDTLKKSLHQEHVIPVVSGGSYTRSNIVPSCKSCNSSKGAKPVEQFATPEAMEKISAFIESVTKKSIVVESVK